MTREKGFDLLVRAFAETAQRRPSWDLVICGEGPERGLLERFAAESGLAERVFLPGWTDDPSEAYKSADL